MNFPSCTLVRQAWLQQILKLSLKSTGHHVIKVREDANTKEIHMSVKPLLLHLYPDKTSLSIGPLTFYQDQAAGFMMQKYTVEGKVILSKIRHKFHDTKENVCQ